METWLSPAPAKEFQTLAEAVHEILHNLRTEDLECPVAQARYGSDAQQLPPFVIQLKALVGMA